VTLIQAVVLFDLVVLTVLAIDFVLVRRTSTSVAAKAPAILIALVFVTLVWQVSERTLEFAATGITVMGTALFGYANFLAFVKRGITFSIIHNHARPPLSRRPDRDFIALAERIDEMRGHGLIEGDGERWWLNARGQRLVRVRRALLRALRIEAVG